MFMSLLFSETQNLFSVLIGDKMSARKVKMLVEKVISQPIEPVMSNKHFLRLQGRPAHCSAQMSS